MAERDISIANVGLVNERWREEMSKKMLVVMRHGKAEPSAQGVPDKDRRLTEAGAMALRARLTDMLGLLKMPDGVARVWTSPATRCLETTEILMGALRDRHVRIEGDPEEHESLWRQDVDAFVDELGASDADVVFAVGHIPFVESAVVRFVDSTPPFATGALGCLEAVFGERDADDATPVLRDARFMWFAQGPVSADWETLMRLRESMERTAAAVEANREAFFADPEDVETIHHFRTKSRSLRSLLSFAKPWQKSEQNAETQQILRDIVRHTSRLRELDVFERQVRRNPDSSPKLIKLAKREASAERAKVLKTLSSKQVTKSFERAMELARNVEWKRRYVRQGLEQGAVRARFDKLVESVTADLESLRLTDEELTHDVRKRAKRARYVSELNKDILGDDAVGIAKGMTAHQDELGDVCDARANIALISEFLEQDLPESVAIELKLLRAQNEAYLYAALKSHREKRH